MDTMINIGVCILLTSSPSFTHRESATAYLRSTPFAWPACHWVSTLPTVDPETRARCATVSAWDDVWLTTCVDRCRPSSWPIMPPIDYVTEDYRHYLGGQFDVEPMWWAYRRATRHWIADQLRRGVSVDVIIDTLNDAADRDREYYCRRVSAYGSDGVDERVLRAIDR